VDVAVQRDREAVRHPGMRPVHGQHRAAGVAVAVLVAGSMRTAALASNDVAQTASAVATGP
jgi:hypothetical protein